MTADRIQKQYVIVAAMLVYRYGLEWNKDPATIICVFWPLHDDHLTAAAQLFGKDEPITVVCFLRANVVQIDAHGILDLRCPKGQREGVHLVRSSDFLQTKFRDAENRDLFLECVPTMMAEQRGGTIFHAYDRTRAEKTRCKGTHLSVRTPRRADGGDQR